MKVRGLLIDIVGFDFIEKYKDRLQVDQYTCRRFFILGEEVIDVR